MQKSAENYESEILSSILAEITKDEQAKTDQQMLLAVEIAEAMKQKGLEKKDLARLMHVKPSVITKWLSGTFQLEMDILNQLEHHLETKLNDRDRGQA